MGKVLFFVLVLMSVSIFSGQRSVCAQTMFNADEDGTAIDVPEPKPTRYPLAPGDFRLPTLGPNGIQAAQTRDEIAISLQIIMILTVLTMAPAIILLMTPFTRIVIVFVLLRQALNTQQVPPQQIIVGLALILTFSIMRPTIDEMHNKAWKPYFDGDKDTTMMIAFDKSSAIMKKWLLPRTRPEDLQFFLDAGGAVGADGKPFTFKSNGFKQENWKDEDFEDLSMFDLVPAFVLSELRRAFQIGFMLYLPFLIIDMVISAVLISMGMMTLPPITISLPFKLILFVLVDGWRLVMDSLYRSFFY
jgi:flagellar biosynthetic protein FliP